MGLIAALPDINTTAVEHAAGTPVRVILAESDSVSRRVIRSVLQEEPGMVLEEVDERVLHATIQTNRPDVVILDGHTSRLRGADSWESLGMVAPPAVILTTYGSVSLLPFASLATDVLEKPFDSQAFRNVLTRAKSRVELAREAEYGRRGWNSPPKSEFANRLAVEAGEKILLIRTADIQWVQSSANQCRVYVASASHVIRQSLTRLHTLLDPARFLRVHRNAIVNLDHVEEFHLPTAGNMFIKLRTGVCLPLRRSSRATLRRRLCQCIHF
jgi:two-component system LytT family response regulator